MLLLQVDCGDIRNVDFGIVGINNFGIVGKAGKVSSAGAACGSIVLT